MGFVSCTFYSAAVVTTWGAFWKHFYRPQCFPDETHFVTTPDGWRLALSRYLPAHPDGKKRKHPVVLGHGLGRTGSDST